MQTRNPGEKLPIFIPHPSFENANQQGFSKKNNALAKYHFWFSESSTRFPCKILQETLILTEISDFERLYQGKLVSNKWQFTSIYSTFMAFLLAENRWNFCFKKMKNQAKNGLSPYPGWMESKLAKKWLFGSVFGSREDAFDVQFFPTLQVVRDKNRVPRGGRFIWNFYLIFRVEHPRFSTSG